MVLETAPWIKSFPIVTSVYHNWQPVSKAYTYFWKRAAITKAAILPQHIYAVCRCVLMWYYVVEWQCFWVKRYLPALCFVKGKVNIIYCTGNILITFSFQYFNNLFDLLFKRYSHRVVWVSFLIRFKIPGCHVQCPLSGFWVWANPTKFYIIMQVLELNSSA